jgi:hypothetical protein
MVYALLPMSIKEYKDLMAKLVCDVTSRNCMIHQCDKCPGVEGLSNFLTELFASADMEDDDIITFKQWEQADYGVNIVTRSETVSVFIEELCKQMDILTSHHFIAKVQAQFLTDCMSTLAEHSD